MGKRGSWLGLLVAAWLWGQGAAAAPCRYDGSYFRVIREGREYRQKVAPEYQRALAVCGDRTAALYDGTDLTVFDGRTRKFHWETAVAAATGPQLSGGGDTVAFYDGESFLIYQSGRGFFREAVPTDFWYGQVTADSGLAAGYDGESLRIYDQGKFQSVSVGHYRRETRLEANGSFVAFYDGENFVVYEMGGRPVRRPVKYTSFPVLALAPLAVAFYDGESLLGYCGGGRSFAESEVPFDPFARAVTEERGAAPVVEIQGKRYRLDPRSCQWNS